jgi:hypothetical protein
MSADPYDAFSTVETPAQAPPVQPKAQSAPDPYDAISSVEKAPQASPDVPPAPPTQQEISDHIQSLIHDPKVSGKQIRDYYSSLNFKLGEADSANLDKRDEYIAANHTAPTMGVRDYDPSNPADGTVMPSIADNRPYDFQQGMIDGGHHVIANAAGALGFIGNKIGLTNDLGGDVQKYYDQGAATQNTQGSSLGRLAGEGLIVAPTAVAAAPIEAGATAIGAPAALAIGAGMAGEGALAAGLTTDAKTPGGVAKDMATGAVLGVGVGGAARGLRALASTPTATATAGREVLDAADRLSRDGLQVRPLPADVGGTLTKTLSGAVESGHVGAVPIRSAQGAYLDAVEAARDRAASLAGNGAAPRDLESVGSDVLHGVGGLGDYEARSGEHAGKLYDDAAALAGNTQISTPRTLNAVNALIGRAEQTPGNSAGLDALKSLRDDLTPTPDSVSKPSIWDREFGGEASPTVSQGNRAQYAIDNLRRLRTSFGDNFDAGQRSARDAANTLWGPLSDDIQDGLKAAGKTDAADAYNAADAHFAQRQQNLDNIVKPILANRSSEQLGQHLGNLARNNSDLLHQGLGLMDSDQAAQTRAAIVGSLGKASAGTQNAANDAFSLSKFGTDWSKLSSGTKSALSSGQSGQDLEDIARLSQSNKESAGFRNHSGTARAMHTLQGVVRGGLLLAHPFATLGEAGGEYALGRGLASPTAARALTRLGEARPISTMTGYAGYSPAADAVIGNNIKNSLNDDQH